MADNPVIEDADEGEATPGAGEATVYKHTLEGHGVRGDGAFEEVIASSAADDYRQQKLPEIEDVLFKKAPDEPMEPLPEIPKMPMTVDEAYEFLGVPTHDRGDLEKLKKVFRKMSLKWHPDKNMKRQEEASEVFRAVHAAYHFLTTNNFDYERWAEAFVIPPMQSLEDVLMMALKGADPYQVEILLKRRGDYRPHAEFGINLNVPWSAGTKEDASWHVGDSARAYSKTQSLEDRRRAELGYGGAGYGDGAIITTTEHMDQSDLIQHFGAKAAVGADAEARPWEMVGGTGFEKPAASKQKSVYKAPETRPDLSSKSPEAKEVAEQFNDRAVKAFKAKDYQLCYDLSSEAIRLHPKKTAYLGNRAAAALKLKGKRHLRQAAEDSVLAYELDPRYVKAYIRAAEAHLALGERATVKLSIKELERALEFEPENAKYKELLRDAMLTWEADFD